MFRKIIRRVFSVLLVAVILAFIWNTIQELRYRSKMPLGEEIAPAEDAAMADAVAMALKMINQTRDGLIDHGIQGDQTLVGEDYEVLPDLDPGERAEPLAGSREGPVVYRRDVHIKSHGCVKATFNVAPVEERFRWGVFSEPKEYEAWIRYSNGDYRLHPDKQWDARGMAVKLLDVEGEKLLEWQKSAKTQDFVMMNSPNYFIRYLEDYVELTKYLAVGDNFGYFTRGWSWNPFTWRWRELRLVGGTKKPAPKSPLLAQYFSASAYALGPDQYIKFSARPVACEGQSELWEPTRPKIDTDDYNFLRLRMAKQLRAGKACFDFMVQPQVPGKQMPVEDATIVWDEDDSPFVPVARIEIPQQSFDSGPQNQFCENLSFNPWHSLPEHRPVGVFNRVRKALYEEVAKYRWASNRQQYEGEETITLAMSQPPEPVSWCLDGTDGDCPPVLDPEPKKESGEGN